MFIYKRKKFSHLLQWRKIERGAVLKHIGASSNTQFSKAIISIPTFFEESHSSRDTRKILFPELLFDNNIKDIDENNNYNV